MNLRSCIVLQKQLLANIFHQAIAGCTILKSCDAVWGINVTDEESYNIISSSPRKLWSN